VFWCCTNSTKAGSSLAGVHRMGHDSISAHSSDFPPRLQGDEASTAEHSTAPGRSGTSSNSSLSRQEADPTRRGHCTQPSFSHYVNGASTFRSGEHSQRSFQHPVGSSQLANMPPLERSSRADSTTQPDSHPRLVRQTGSVQSETDTPTLGDRGSQMSSTIVHEDVMSSNGTLQGVPSSAGPSGLKRNRCGEPTAEGTGRDNPRSSDDLPVSSPFEQQVPGPLLSRSPIREVEHVPDNHTGGHTPPSHQVWATSLLAHGRPAGLLSSELHEMQGEASTAAGDGVHASYMHGPGGRRGRPPMLMIEYPNDAASTTASDHQGAGFRFDTAVVGGGPSLHSEAVAAVANDRNVIDAEDRWNADIMSAGQQVSYVQERPILLSSLLSEILVFLAASHCQDLKADNRPESHKRNECGTIISSDRYLTSCIATCTSSDSFVHAC
jgi:hypothetical protein